MEQFLEKLKIGLNAVRSFFRSVQQSLAPVFSKVGRVFATEKTKKVGKDILSGKINLISILFTMTLIGFLIGGFVMFFTSDVALKQILFYDYEDWFMDFFNTMSDSEYPGLYREYHILYAPIVVIPLNLLYHLIPSYELLHGREIRDTQVGMICFLFVMIIAFVALIALIYREKKGTSLEKICFIVGMLFSVGMISVVDRGNVIIYAVLFSSAFLALYKSEKWYVREISYVCLALAVCIKIYPVFLGVLILRNRQWSGAIRTVVYWLVLFVTPFLYYGRMAENILVYMQTVFNFGTTNKEPVDAEKATSFFERLVAFAEEVTETEKQFFTNFAGQKVYYDYIDGKNAFTYTGTFQILFASLYRNYETLEVCQKLSKGLLFACFFTSLFQDEDWKTATLLSIFSVTFTPSTFAYSITFMIFPCLMFLNKANFKNPLHWIYAALFLAMFALILYEEQYYHVDKWYQNGEYYYLNLPNLVERFSILIMTFLLSCEGVFRMILLFEDGIIYLIRRNRRRMLHSKVVEEKPRKARG